MAATLVASIMPRWTESEGASAAFASAPTALSPTPAITPVTPLPPLDSSASSGDSVNNTGEYIVIGVVLGIMAIVITVFVVLWFVVD